MSIDLDAVERELIEEGVMDQLLERPGKQYTDVQEMVADLRVEQRRGFEDSKRQGNGDDDDVSESSDINENLEPLRFPMPRKTKPDAVFGAWLFVGTWEHARDRSLLEELSIEYVVDVEQGGKKADFLAADKYIGRPMCDFGSTTISSILNELLDFILAVRQKKSKVLVQCEWGINRR
jgi:hypothetical protein